MKDKDASKAVSRRAFLDYSIRSIGAFITAVVGVAVTGYSISPVFTTRKDEWVQVGSVNDFKVNQPKSVEFTLFRKDGWVDVSDKKTLWVVRHSDTEFTLFNPRCTHLGCAFNWNAQTNQFLCPCHNGIFDISGKVIGGPPPRALDSMEYKIEGSTLSCVYKDFRLGVTDKTAV